MKNVCISLLIIIFPFACSLSGDNSTISGTYVRVDETELYTLYDTLTVQPVNNQANTSEYNVIQKSQTLFKKETEQKFNKKDKHTLTGTYDAQNSILHTSDPGIKYSLDKKSLTSVNGILYQKID